MGNYSINSVEIILKSILASQQQGCKKAECNYNFSNQLKGNKSIDEHYNYIIFIEPERVYTVCFIRCTGLIKWNLLGISLY